MFNEDASCVSTQLVNVIPPCACVHVCVLECGCILMITRIVLHRNTAEELSRKTFKLEKTIFLILHLSGRRVMETLFMHFKLEMCCVLNGRIEVTLF